MSMNSYCQCQNSLEMNLFFNILSMFSMQIEISALFLSSVESSNNGVAEPSKCSLALGININKQTQRGYKI